jgi:hypothetical protein
VGEEIAHLSDLLSSGRVSVKRARGRDTQMALSAFDDKSKPPTPQSIKKVLGKSAIHWEDLVRFLASEYKPLTEKWGFAGKDWGWALRLIQKKRTILYMTPSRGHFLVGFALGEKAVKAAHASSLPGSILDLIDGAPKYAEGRAVRIEVRSKKAREAIKILASIKMAN